VPAHRGAASESAAIAAATFDIDGWSRSPKSSFPDGANHFAHQFSRFGHRRIDRRFCRAQLCRHTRATSTLSTFKTLDPQGIIHGK